MLTLADKAYQAIEELIVTLELKPGSVFSESEISEKLNIGRTPIREALLRLSQERLVLSMPRRGIVVTDINVSEQLALLDTRRVLDELIVKQACKRANKEQIERLKTVANKMENAADSESIPEFMRLDKEFDSILNEASRNIYAAQATTPLHAHCRRFWYYYRRNNDLRESTSFHTDIMKAVSVQDETKAVQASNKLIDFLVDFTKSILE